VIATAVMASYSQTVFETIKGVSVAVGTLPTATAFNIIFAVGIVLTLVVAGLAAASKNFILKKDNPAAK
jgi:hypothetical protein